MLTYWIGRFPWFFPLPLTLASVIVIYGVLLPIHQWSDNSDLTVSILFFAWALFAYICVYRIISHLTKVPTVFRTKVLGWIDGYVALTHALGGVTFGIYVLNNANYTGIPAGVKGYDLFWTYAYVNVLYLFNTAGRGNVMGASALGVVPGVLSSVSGVVYIMLMFVVLIVRFYPMPHKFAESDMSAVYNSGVKRGGQSMPRKNYRGPRAGRGIPMITKRK